MFYWTYGIFSIKIIPGNKIVVMTLLDIRKSTAMTDICVYIYRYIYTYILVIFIILTIKLHKHFLKCSY